MRKKIGALLLAILLMANMCSAYCGVSATGSTELVLTCKSNVEPFAIFEQSEDVKFHTNAERGTYQITDYYGNTSIDESFANNEIVIQGLPLGRYTIYVNDGTNSTTSGFSVVMDLDKRRDSSQSGFGLSAMASHLYSSEGREEAYVKTISLAGVPYVREFCNASEVTNSKNKRNQRFNKLLDEYYKNGIKTTFMFQGLPGEDKTTGEGLEDGHELTRNMYSVYHLVKDICEQNGECLDAIEVENEVDVWVSKCDGPDLYAAFLKTAAIAAADYSDDLLVSTTGFTEEPHEYVEKLFGNGVADYIDVYNVHHYELRDTEKNITEYPTELSEYFPKAEEYGLTEKLLWAGEFGLRFPYEENRDELTEAQQKQQARTAPTAWIEARSAGVDKAFWFTHGYIYESSYGVYNGFGTMDQKHCPNMSYSSISALTNALGNAKYKGKFRVSGTNVKAHCYADNNTEIACLWAENEESVTLAVRSGTVTCTDIMGNEEEMEVTDGRVTITAGPDIQYIRAENGFSSGSVVENAKFDKAYKRSKLTKAQKIVMLPLFSAEAETEARTKCYQLSATSDNAVTLKVYNFNNEPMAGTVTPAVPEGWEISTGQQSVYLEPMGCAELNYTVKKKGIGNATKCLPLVFEGEFGNEKASPAVSYIGTQLTTDYTYSPSINVDYISYDGQTLRSGLIGDVKDAKFVIDGRVYNANVGNGTAEADVVLPTGFYDIKTCVFDVSGSVVTYTDTVTVNLNEEYTVSYDANGGGSPPMTQIVTAGDKVRLSNERPYKHNSVFMGWSTEKNTDAPKYHPGDTVEVSKDMTLYAVWKNEDSVEAIDIKHAVLCNAEKAVIKGKTSVAYGGKEATFVVFDGGASPNNLTPADIVNIGEVRIGLDGSYTIAFRVDGTKTYRYIMNVGGEVIDSYISETTWIYNWMDKDVFVRQYDNSMEVIVKFKNYGDEDAYVALITGMFGENNRLLDVHYAKLKVNPGSVGMGEVYNIPDGTVMKKVFLWSDDGKLIPLSDVKIITKK